MISRAFLAVVLFSLYVVAFRDVRFRHFDDYLSSLNDKEQAKITGEDAMDEGSGEPEERVSFLTNDERPERPMPLRTGFRRSKDASCCSLGFLAADKGYHCFAKFYAARIILRNKNRAHNRKMAFYGRDRMNNYGTKVMRTFEQCVAARGVVFHKCCHLASMERKSYTHPHYDTLQRAKYFRSGRPRLGVEK